jgi:arylformamidase
MNASKACTRLIDVTVPLSPRTPIWPGAPRLEVSRKHRELAGGGLATGSSFSMTVHCGTHVDAPLHFVRGGQTIDALDLDLLVGPCRVWEHMADGHISKDDLDKMGFVPEKRTVFKTRNSTSVRRGEFDQNYISFLPDAIEHFIRSGVKLLGTDAFSVGPFGELTERNHVSFCGAGGVIIEVLDLSDVEPGRYDLIALPIKLEGFEGAPARVLLLRPEDLNETFGGDASRAALS